MYNTSPNEERKLPVIPKIQQEIPERKPVRVYVTSLPEKWNPNTRKHKRWQQNRKQICNLTPVDLGDAVHVQSGRRTSIVEVPEGVRYSIKYRRHTETDVGERIGEVQCETRPLNEFGKTP